MLDGLVGETREIPGRPGYRAGADGDIWSNRKNARPYGLWRRLSSRLHHSGYFIVNIRVNGDLRVEFVHKLVLLAFVGQRPEGQQACHWPDPDTKNNSIANLRWDTFKANRREQRPRGKSIDRGRVAKLNEEAVAEIRRRVAGGESRKALAREYRCHYTTISYLVSGRLVVGKRQRESVEPCPACPIDRKP